MPLAPGTRLAQYEIIAPLGSGGMGDVYRARDSRLGRDVAVKVMAPHIAADPEMRRRFETEARAVAGLSHPSILAIHELAVVDDVAIAVMELLEGETLRERLRRARCRGAMPSQIAAAIAEGLAAAHARGIIHRDLKPENVFLTPTERSRFSTSVSRCSVSRDRNLTATARRSRRRHRASCSARSDTCRPSRSLASASTAAPTSSRSAASSTRCSAASGSFAGATPQETSSRKLLHEALPELRDLRSARPAGASLDRGARGQSRSAPAASTRQRCRDGPAIAADRVTAAPTNRRARPRGKSLAVLPFVNAGADPQIEHISDGVAESIINSLSQLSGIRVVPAASSSATRGCRRIRRPSVWP